MVEVRKIFLEEKKYLAPKNTGVRLDGVSRSKARWPLVELDSNDCDILDHPLTLDNQQPDQGSAAPHAKHVREDRRSARRLFHDNLGYWSQGQPCLSEQGLKALGAWFKT